MFRFTLLFFPVGPEVSQRAFGELSCGEHMGQHKQPRFSISRLKVTNWQEGLVPRGHLTRRRSLCKSSCPRTYRVLSPGMKSGILEGGSARRLADIRSAAWEVWGYSTRLKWPVFKLFYFQTIKLSFVTQVQMIRFPVFAYGRQSNSPTEHTQMRYFPICDVRQLRLLLYAFSASVRKNGCLLIHPLSLHHTVRKGFLFAREFFTFFHLNLETALECFSFNVNQKEAPPPCFSLLSLNSCPS